MRTEKESRKEREEHGIWEEETYLDVCCGGALCEACDLNNIAARAGALDGKTSLVTYGIT